MCSLNGYRCNSNDDEIPKNTKDSLIDIKVCRKCRIKDVDVLLLGQNGYCNMCFLTATNHKFRAALGKSKIIRHGDSILVDHSGELNSTVLLHLIKTGMNESTHKKLIFKTTVLYIDDALPNEITDEDRNSLQCKIAEQTKNFGFAYYIVSLSQVLNKDDTLDIRQFDNQLVKDNNDEQLHEILTNLPDNTSRTDLLEQLRRKLLLSAARKLNCNKVFVADSTMDIATKVLGNICLGRGAQLSTLATFCDTRCTDIKILKPMRDFTQQEMMYYSQCHSLNPIKSKKINVTTQPATSIQALTYNFIMGMESQFSSTISTIMRTAEKVSARNNKDNQDMENCVLCDASLDSVSSENNVTAMKAIEVSSLVSSKYFNARTSVTDKENESFSDKKSDRTSQCLSNNQKCCNNNSSQCGCMNGKMGQLTTEDVQKCLCYSCQLIFRNSNLLSRLPASLLFAVQQRLALKKMKEDISDFLI
ncbi:PREDICTED: cytoplasmic tRNA 2-thiolation protein 2 [Dinoponera quadriceps]|uniref:Cytoplasmic tRNA 2-thiolation protein 2 n=1 Tax=Dinoponera quadriceps TaxID=609295 RepID=A0A6P3XYT8_DINQU|nr:PREDICTED: cytoplasmic tRNA 2-thiolation protein 2 [Dinoponera quadriceps]